MERNSDTFSASTILPEFQFLELSDSFLDLGPEFAKSKSLQELVANINMLLHLHRHKKLENFRLYFTPLVMYLGDLHNWIEFASTKQLKQLELDLSLEFDTSTDQYSNGADFYQLPSYFFEHFDTLEHLSLSHCNFYPPTDFVNFKLLHALSLNNVAITNYMLEFIIAYCAQLHSLSLKCCREPLQNIRVVGQDLKLQRLEIIDCWSIFEIEMSAPNMISFIFHGEHCFTNINVPCLNEAFISSENCEHSEPDHDYIKLISDIAHVKVLTVCYATPLRFAIYEEIDAEMLPIIMPNLKEIQLLLYIFNLEYLSFLYCFLRLCHFPSVEKIFIQLPAGPEWTSGHTYLKSSDVKEPTEVTLNYVKVIKLNNFKGSENEMRLLEFLLHEASALENLVLITPQECSKMEIDSKQHNDPTESIGSVDMMLLYQQVVSLPKASIGANIVLCKFSDDDKAFAPTHTEYYV